MPSFSVETWESFKVQFMSVIRFLLYSFDIMFDAVRSNPLLYVFVFFPIFAAAFLIGLSLFSKLRVGSFNSFSGVKPFTHNFGGKGVSSRYKKTASVNLAKSSINGAKLQSNIKYSRLRSGKRYSGLRSGNFGSLKSISFSRKKHGNNSKNKNSTSMSSWKSFGGDYTGKKSKDVDKNIEVDE